MIDEGHFDKIEYIVFLTDHSPRTSWNAFVAERRNFTCSLFDFCAIANAANGCATEAAKRVGWKIVCKDHMGMRRSPSSMCFAPSSKNKAVRCGLDRQTRGSVSHVPLPCTNPVPRDKSDDHVMVPGIRQRRRKVKHRLAKHP